LSVRDEIVLGETVCSIPETTEGEAEAEETADEYVRWTIQGLLVDVV
jgi:hypothetical protein